MFKSVGEVHGRTTGQTCKNDSYLPPRAKLNVYRDTIRYFGAQIWNNLPVNVKYIRCHLFKCLNQTTLKCILVKTTTSQLVCMFLTTRF